MGEAARIIYEHLEENTAHMRELKEYFARELKKIEGVEINGPRPLRRSASYFKCQLSGCEK